MFPSLIISSDQDTQTDRCSEGETRTPAADRRRSFKGVIVMENDQNSKVDPKL